MASIRWAAQAGTDGGSNATITKGPGTANGDRLVLIVINDGTDGAFSTPAVPLTGQAWSLLSTSTEIGTDELTPKGKVYEYKTTTNAASLPASWAIVPDGFLASNCWMYCIQDLDPSAVLLIDWADGQLPASPAGSRLVTAKSLSGYVGSDPILLTGMTCTTEYADPTYSVPSGMTATGAVIDSDWMTGRGFYQSLTGTGATGAKSSQISLTGTFKWRAVSVAVPTGGFTSEVDGTATLSLGGLTLGAAGAGYRLTETLTDDFDDGTVNLTKFPNGLGAGAIAETGGKLTIAATTDGDPTAVEAAAVYRLSTITAQVTPPSRNGGAWALAALTTYVAPDFDSYATAYVSIESDDTYDVGLLVREDGVNVGGPSTGDLSAGDVAWLRLREDAGTLYAEYSATGTDGSWSVAGSVATPSGIAESVTSTVTLEAWRSVGDASSADGPATFDNLNLPPAFAVIDGTATMAGPALTLAASGTGFTVETGTAALAGPALNLAASGLRTTPGQAELFGPALGLTAAGVVTGAGAASLDGPALQLAADGTVSVDGAALLELGALTLAAAGARTGAGTAELPGPQLTLAAAGVVGVDGTAELAGPALTLSGLGAGGTGGAASLPGPALTVSADGVVSVVAQATLGGPALTLAAAGLPTVHGAATVALGPLTLATAGSVDVVGAAAVAGPALQLAAAGQNTVHAAAELLLGGLQLAAAGIGEGPGGARINLGRLALTAAGVTTGHGEAALDLGALQLAAAGHRDHTGVAALDLGALTLAAAGVPTVHAAAGLTGPALQVTAAGLRTVHGAALLDGPALQLAAGGGVTVHAAALLPGPALALSGLGAGVLVVPGTAALDLGPLQLATAGTTTVHGAASLPLAALVLAVAGTRVVTGGAVAVQLGPLTLEITDSVPGAASFLLAALTVHARGTGGPELGSWWQLVAQQEHRDLVPVELRCPNDRIPLQLDADGAYVCPFDGWRPGRLTEGAAAW